MYPGEQFIEPEVVHHNGLDQVISEIPGNIYREDHQMVNFNFTDLL
jgi:hypothetical protein